MTHQIMQDPHLIDSEPGHSYEQECIQAWLESCSLQGRPYTSPVTKPEMIPPSIVSATARRASLDQPDPNPSIICPNPIFTTLGPLLGNASLEGWKPPQITVLGEAGAGKSTLQERLCAMPVFRHGDDVSTSVPIHLRMGSTATPRVPTIAVHNLRTAEKSLQIVLMGLAVEEIRAAMDRVL